MYKNLTYINTSSNHPLNIIKQLTKTVSGYPEILQVLKFSTVPNLNTKLL